MKASEIKTYIVNILNAASITATISADPYLSGALTDLPMINIYVAGQNGAAITPDAPAFNEVLTVSIIITATSFASADSLIEDCKTAIFNDATFINKINEISSFDVSTTYDKSSESLIVASDLSITINQIRNY